MSREPPHAPLGPDAAPVGAVDQDVARDHVGQDAGGTFGPSERLGRARLDPMPQFYARVIAGLIGRAAVLFDVGLLRLGGAG